MAFTLTQLQALEEAIGTGALKVVFDGREVTYRSMKDLLAAYNVVKSALETAGTVTKRRRHSVIKRRMD